MRATRVPSRRRERVDLLRITWPNGIVQEVEDLEAGAYVIRQTRGSGRLLSVPLLVERLDLRVRERRAWDHTARPSDGARPAGPARPRRVRAGAQPSSLRRSTATYELQFTEELREVSYLDRIRLDVIDHPAGTEVYPNERFCFPPFPEAHDPHRARHRSLADGARDRRRRASDWTAELAARSTASTLCPSSPLFEPDARTGLAPLDLELVLRRRGRARRGLAAAPR